MLLQIGNQTWTIKEVDVNDNVIVFEKEVRQGATDFSAQTIALLKMLPSDRKREVLIHELTHAYIYATQIHYMQEDFTEENMCELMALYADSIVKDADFYFAKTKEPENGTNE